MLMLLVQTPCFKELRIEPLTLDKCRGHSASHLPWGRAAVIVCSRSRLQGISRSLSASAWGKAFCSWRRMWLLACFPIWGAPWKGCTHVGWKGCKVLSQVGALTSRLLNLHLENASSSGECPQHSWCSYSAPRAPSVCPCPPPRIQRLSLQDWLRLSSKIFVNEPKHLYGRKKSNP